MMFEPLDLVNWPAESRLVDPEFVNMDSRYQRSFKHRPYQGELPQEFILRNSPVILNERVKGSGPEKGQYLYCMDGQHTVREALRLGVDRIRALVFLDLPEEVESIFLADRDEISRKMQAPELERARVHGGSPRSVALDNLIKEEGLVLIEHGRLTANHTWLGFTCLGVMRTIIRELGGIEHLRHTVQFMKATWPETPTLFKGDRLQGVARFLRKLEQEYPTVSLNEISTLVHDVVWPDVVHPSKGHSSSYYAAALMEQFVQLRVKRLLQEPAEEPA